MPKLPLETIQGQLVKMGDPLGGYVVESLKVMSPPLPTQILTAWSSSAWTADMTW